MSQRLNCTIVHTLAVAYPLLTFIILFYIIYFSGTAEHNLMKLHRNQELNILYKVSVFQAN